MMMMGKMVSSLFPDIVQKIPLEELFLMYLSSFFKTILQTPCEWF